MNAGLFKGVVLNNSLHLSHLFYVDDAIFIGQWCTSNITAIIRVLECFFHASGLRINLQKTPVQVINKLEAIRSHFFHGVDPSVRKMMLVKWNNVLASKEMGGLGVSSFYALNRALIFKLIWRFRTQGGSEQVQMASLLSLLEGLILPNMIDRWMWSISEDEGFSVSS
nr:RNA-directed DNA polymerase, eukaryota, reverse transcriptase zinc-binding domain protein [Tanacetum cinerariifolium]